VSAFQFPNNAVNDKAADNPSQQDDAKHSEEFEHFLSPLFSKLREHCRLIPPRSPQTNWVVTFFLIVLFPDNRSKFDFSWNHAFDEGQERLSFLRI
jgi:hypothetical protein